MILYSKKSKLPGAGKGVFARCDILSNTILGKYGGKKMNKKAYLPLRDKRYIWELSNGMYLDGHPKHRRHTILSFINGAKTKGQRKFINAYAYQYKKNIFYKTLRNIKKGEEIVIDYGNFYWGK